VFLPSWKSIVDVYNQLAAKPGVFECCIIHVLHSSLPMSEQQAVFEHAPPGGHLQTPLLPQFRADLRLFLVGVHFAVDLTLSQGAAKERSAHRLYACSSSRPSVWSWGAA
jgi:hypothetical protein